MLSLLLRVDSRLVRPIALSYLLRIPIDFAMLGVEPEAWHLYAATKPPCYAFSITQAVAQAMRGCSKLFLVGDERVALALDGVDIEVVAVDKEVEIDLGELARHARDFAPDVSTPMPLKNLEIEAVRRLYAVGALFISGGLLVPSRGLVAATTLQPR